MPGLLRGVARTAAIAGTATAVSSRVSRRQARKWQAQGTYPYDQQEPVQEEAPEAAAPAPDMIQQLKDLAELKNEGVLTEEEFATQKARILGS
jgi:hypothetical protein